MEKLKSTAKRTKELEYNKEFVVKQLNANPNVVKQQEEQLKKMNPNATAEVIQRQVMNLVVRENVFNNVMQGIVEHYDFNLDKDEVTKFEEKMKSIYKDAKPEVLTKLTENMLKKTLVYEDLSSLWDIRTNDDETRQWLQNYYKATNNPIRDIMNDKEKFDNFRQMIQDEKVTNEILMRFRNVKFDLPKKENKEEQPK